MNKYAIGDLHGNFKGLIQAIERSPFKPEKDKLITLGDYIDGGNHIEVLPIMNYLLELPNWVGIIGNHDMWMLEHINSGWNIVEHIWYTQGGRQTLESMGIGTSLTYLKGPAGTIEMSHRVFNGDCPALPRKFLKELRLFHVDEDDNAYVHAGWNKRKERIENSYSFQFAKEDLYWDRSFWEQSASKGYANPPYNKVFIGHTQSRKHPEKRNNVWNLDSGAGWSGKVTIMNVDTEEYWQSDTVSELYENYSRR